MSTNRLNWLIIVLLEYYMHRVGRALMSRYNERRGSFPPMQPNSSVFLCMLPRMPLLHFPNCSFITRCCPLSFIKCDKCLCLTLRWARCRHGGGCTAHILTLSLNCKHWLWTGGGGGAVRSPYSVSVVWARSACEDLLILHFGFLSVNSAKMW